MLAELFEEGVGFAAYHVEREVGLARGEAGEGPVALAAASVGLVVVLAEANDGRPPHNGLLSRHLLKHLEEDEGVFSLLLGLNAVDKLARVDVRGLGFVFHRLGGWGLVDKSIYELSQVAD